jgi:hypothetical protein
VTSLSKAGVGLTAVLILAPYGGGSAASSPEAPPARAESQATPVAQPQHEPAPPRARQGRQSKRSPRASTRPRSPRARESLQEERASRVAGPTTQGLVLTASALGGYDDNLTAGSGTGAGIVPRAIASGSTGYLDATLDYFRGNTSRAIRIGSTGNLRAYPGHLDGPASGGIATVEARTTVGRTLTVRASERVGYEPFFGVFSPGASSASLPPAIGETVPATVLFERRSLSSASSLSFHQQWTRHDSTLFSYSYRVQQFTGDDYGDNSSHDVRAEYRRRLARGVRVRGDGRYMNREHTGADGSRVETPEYRIEGGSDIVTTLSRRRYLRVSAAGGTTRIASTGAPGREPYHAWVPTGGGSATLGLTSLWSVEGGYRRHFSLLRGLTNELYGTHTAYLTTGGPVAARTEVRVGTTYSSWRTPVVSGVNDALRVYGGSAQVTVSLNARTAAAAGYYYYHHRYSNPSALPTGFPPKYDRHAVRVGLTVRFPLWGTEHQFSGAQ